ncbi:major allergen Mal d 1-like [Macadamia integrifolia]|uniref:major allergen Mal d 1-like n=1 Tax=Macadamia integrifolia TaxID=60698 RepID=UPI001C4F426B|nr:major allergen Mal d 1-like [Macadamia integrifolia]
MAVTTISNEFSCPIPPARLFKAAVLDAHNLLPKIVPDKIKSIEIQGDGGAGSIKQINLADDGPFDFIKHRIEEVDEQNFKCKFTLDICFELLKVQHWVTTAVLAGGVTDIPQHSITHTNTTLCDVVSCSHS